jgi:hypothetical protein
VFSIAKNTTGKRVLHRKIKIRRKNKREEERNERKEDGR